MSESDAPVSSEPVRYSTKDSENNWVELVPKSELDAEYATAKAFEERAIHYEELYRKTRSAYEKRKNRYSAADMFFAFGTIMFFGFLIWLLATLRVPIR